MSLVKHLAPPKFAGLGHHQTCLTGLPALQLMLSIPAERKILLSKDYTPELVRSVMAAMRPAVDCGALAKESPAPSCSAWCTTDLESLVNIGSVLYPEMAMQGAEPGAAGAPDCNTPQESVLKSGPFAAASTLTTPAGIGRQMPTNADMLRDHVMHGDMQKLALQLKAKANPSSDIDEEGLTPLMVAAALGHLPAIELLVFEGGANLDAQSKAISDISQEVEEVNSNSKKCDANLRLLLMRAD